MNKRIVFIVGAGASNALHPQFALGPELLQQISDRVTDRTSPQPFLSSLLNNVGFNEAIRSDFVRDLDKYKASTKFPSIDGFLDEVSSYPEYEAIRQEYNQLGKFAIMFHILGYEAELKRKGVENVGRGPWINVVAKFIDEAKLLNTDILPAHDLKIITFNYDRTIEHLLYNHSRFKNRRQLIGKFLDDCIVHVYGKVGELKWQNSDRFFDFGEDNGKGNKIFSEKNRINTMYVDRMESNKEAIEKAGAWIHTEETILVCAFGFNFDLINYRLLSLQNLGIAGTAKLVANIYPFGDLDFTNRRMMADRIRTIKHDARLEYMTCTDFLETNLNL